MSSSTSEAATRVHTPVEGEVDIEKLKNTLQNDKIVPPPREPLKGFRKFVLMVLLCCAQFFDIVNASCATVALPTVSVPISDCLLHDLNISSMQIAKDLNFSPGAIQWVLSAYTLTFASFLVSAGRLTDIYNPKLIFCAGFLTVGIFSVLCAVSVAPVMLLVFRAIQGLGAALTLPSAIAMIVTNIPEPNEQAQALAIFGASGALGMVAGGILVSSRPIYSTLSLPTTYPILGRCSHRERKLALGLVGYTSTSCIAAYTDLFYSFLSDRYLCHSIFHPVVLLLASARCEPRDKRPKNRLVWNRRSYRRAHPLRLRYL